jgi:hypothetical protein
MKERLKEAVAAMLAGMAASMLARGWAGSEKDGLAAADLAKARDILKEKPIQ